MIPLHRISTNAVIPTTIVTSPGFQVSLCPRATIHDRMNGAAHAATRSQSSVLNTCHALALSLNPMPAESIAEFLFDSSVVNHGSQSDAKSTSAAPIPRNSPGDSRERSR
jgi:hypothetical protein